MNLNFPSETPMNLNNHPIDVLVKFDNSTHFISEVSTNRNATGTTSSNNDEIADYRFMCDICGLTYKGQKALEIHLGIHNGISPFACHICNKIFTQKIGLKKHLLIHDGIAQYFCQFCERSFIHEKSYKHHVRNHTGNKVVYCSTCNAGFNSKAYLERHLLIHTRERPFLCDICCRSFNQKSNLYAHRRKLHSGCNNAKKRAIQRSCPLCGLSYDRLKLAEHLSEYHNAASNE